MKSIRSYYCGVVLPLMIFTGILSSCDGFFKNDYRDNSPTSGRLKVYYDEGLETHVKNQTLTFLSQYSNAHVELFSTNEKHAVQALYNDSCEAIVISRLLSEEEKKAFGSKVYYPKFSAVAVSGVLMITHTATPVRFLNVLQVKNLLSVSPEITDSSGNKLFVKVLLDKNNSGVMNYLLDSVTGIKSFPSYCNVLDGTLETINYVATHANTIGFIDFAWLSDTDDSLYKANKDKLRFIAVENADRKLVFPDQSSLKLGEYPFARTVYVYRKTGDFTLAKGFESFVAGPKGQLTFLKQGLLPHRQNERMVKINLESGPQ